MRDDRKWIGGAVLALALLLTPAPALAYIGPGVGVGLISAVIGVLGSIFLGLFAIIWYPIKRLRKKMQKRNKADGSAKDPK
ncbi:MAG: hypothetical protein ABI395_04960 [Sphingobium sp.]